MSPVRTDIHGGYVPSWRKELESEVWLMPPIYHRVWYWLRMNVQYEPFLFPTRERFGIWILPGQRLTSLQQIAEGVKWSEWGVESVPNKKTIRDVLDWLIQHEMVTAESNAKGTLITIVNWHSYNSNITERVTAQSNAKGTRSGRKGEGEKRIRKKSLPAKIPADSRYFAEWWGFSFNILGCRPYIFEGAKDGAHVSFLLKNIPLEELILRACDFLTSDDPFLRGKRNLSLFRSWINKTSSGGNRVEYRQEGIFPPEGIALKDWHPWDSPEQEAAHG